MGSEFTNKVKKLTINPPILSNVAPKKMFTRWGNHILNYRVWLLQCSKKRNCGLKQVSTRGASAGKDKKGPHQVLLQTHSAERASENALTGVRGSRILTLFVASSGITTLGIRHLLPTLEALMECIMHQAHSLEALQAKTCLQFAQAYFQGG